MDIFLACVVSFIGLTPLIWSWKQASLFNPNIILPWYRCISRAYWFLSIWFLTQPLLFITVVDLRDIVLLINVGMFVLNSIVISRDVVILKRFVSVEPARRDIRLGDTLPVQTHYTVPAVMQFNIVYGPILCYILYDMQSHMIGPVYGLSLFAVLYVTNFVWLYLLLR